jgi:surface antigen
MKGLAGSVLLVLCFVVSNTAYAETFGTNLGNFDGVTVYSNDYPTYVSGSNNVSQGLITGMKWQCVEFVRRYYLKIFSINLRALYSGGNANTWYDHADDMHLARYANGSSVKPRAGDIIVSSGGTYGHVAIVSDVSDNEVCIVEQNFHNDARDANGSHCLTMTGSSSDGYNISGFDSNYPIQGWLRPYCDIGNEKCNVRYYGNIGWFPAVSDCHKATRWFVLEDSGDGKIPVAMANSSVCEQIPPACLQ